MGLFFKIGAGKRFPIGANVTLVRLERTNVTLVPNKQAFLTGR